MLNSKSDRAEGKSRLIPWSPDPEENRRNIEAALADGVTVLLGERDDNGEPKRYPINFLEVALCDASEPHSCDRNSGTDPQQEGPRSLIPLSAPRR